MPEPYYIIPKEKHDSLVTQAYLKRGYDAAEAAAGARFCASAAYYGIRTHNAIKALHLDELFGSKVGRWTPGAKIEKLPSRFAAAEIWNGHNKLGQAVAYEAMDTCMKLADKFGVGMVSVDNATHYLWGGRLRHGCRAQGLPRLHELHVGHVRSRAVRRQNAGNFYERGKFNCDERRKTHRADKFRSAG